MSEFRSGGCASGALRGDAVPMGAARCLRLAAAPVFAIMALLTAQQHGGPADILCSAAHGGSPLSGMTLMYALMSIFHVPPWIMLVSTFRADGRPISQRPRLNAGHSDDLR